ncbi:MAG: hypothetical protein H7069_08100, partial [Phormidesmis sp. FL-bin-119]|nr:hypothetical protein [Pedobacter sp.]
LKEKLSILESRDRNQESRITKNYVNPNVISLSKPVYYGILLCLFGLIAFSAYSYYNRTPIIQDSQVTNSVDAAGMDSTSVTKEPEQKEKDDFDKQIRAAIDSVQNADSTLNVGTVQEKPVDGDPQAGQIAGPDPASTDSENGGNQKSAKYTLSATRAYFYDDSNERSRRNSFLAKWNSPELTAIDEKNGFIYVEFFTVNGEITKGWLRKRDLRRIGG